MKALIIYGTKKGTTETCVNKLKTYMKCDTDIINIDDNKEVSLEKYDTVIIGSPVYAGMFIKGIKEFIENNKFELKKKKLGLFMCCMSNDEIVEKQFKENIPEEILEIAKIKGNFGGEFKFSKMNFFEKTIIKMIAKKDKTLGVIDGKSDISKINENNIKSFAKSLEE